MKGRGTRKQKKRGNSKDAHEGNAQGLPFVCETLRVMEQIGAPTSKIFTQMPNLSVNRTEPESHWNLPGDQLLFINNTALE